MTQLFANGIRLFGRFPEVFGGQVDQRITGVDTMLRKSCQVKVTAELPGDLPVYGVAFFLAGTKTVQVYDGVFGFLLQCIIEPDDSGLIVGLDLMRGFLLQYIGLQGRIAGRYFR